MIAPSFTMISPPFTVIGMAPVIVSAASTSGSLDPIYVPAMIGGIFCLLGLVFVIIGRVRTTMCKNWVTTTALIVNRKGTTDGWPARNPTFTWTGPDQKVYKKTSMVNSGIYRLGTYVQVRVDPEQPHRAIIDTFGQKLVFFTVIGSMMLGIGLLLVASAGYLIINR